MRIPSWWRRARAGADERRGRLARSVPVLLLVLSLAVAGLGALQAYQAQRSHRSTADTLLTDYGAFVAWSYADQWTGALNGSLSATLGGIRAAAARGSVTMQCLGLLLAPTSQADPDCGCGEPLRGAATWAFHATYSGGAPSIFTAGPTPGGPELERVVAAVLAHARNGYGPGQMHALVPIAGEQSGRARIMAYTRVRSVEADTVVYGFEIDAAQLRHTFDRILDRTELLPASLARGQPNRSLVAVTFADAAADLLFRSAPDSVFTHPAEQVLPANLGGGVIRASVLPHVADQLIIGGLPRDRVPILLGILALAGVLALMAVLQLRKENLLARLRSDFVASVSHELRSPLAQVRLFVETLRLGRAGTEETRDWALANIDRETLRLAGLVENVLAFSRAERGAFANLELRPADVGDEVAAAAAAFAPLVPQGRMRLEVGTRPGLRARVDADTFRQVVLNLLDNAVKYGPRGQTVRVATTAHDETVRITIEDRGPGVRPEEREAIFEPFRRGRDTLAGAVAGSGIGLSVVREIVRAHGGRAWVEDVPGGGARFVVELPRVHTPQTEQLPAVEERGEVAAAEVA